MSFLCMFKKNPRLHEQPRALQYAGQGGSRRVTLLWHTVRAAEVVNFLQPQIKEIRPKIDFCFMLLSKYWDHNTISLKSELNEVFLVKSEFHSKCFCSTAICKTILQNIVLPYWYLSIFFLRPCSTEALHWMFVWFSASSVSSVLPPLPLQRKRPFLSLTISIWSHLIVSYRIALREPISLLYRITDHLS